MNNVSGLNTNYNDFAGFERMRAEARNNGEQALKQVAKQFESLFVQMMIKSMREASEPLQGELFHSQQGQAYQDMYDKQLGLELTKDNGIGLADVIVRQLSGNVPGALPATPNQPVNQKSVQSSAMLENGLQRASVNLHSKKPDVMVSALEDNNTFRVSDIDKSNHWSSPEQFIQDSWPHAVRAGKALGVDPKVILAQSALETGWGKKVHHTATGENSYCLFGIKANNGWQGKTVAFDTLEFRSGAMNREQGKFRAYDSVAEAYQDYVQFLQQNPRYRKVLESSTPGQYATELRKAGYATDPQYDRKIERIHQGELLNNTLSSLKFDEEVPLS